MAKFARIIELKNNEQVLLTVEFNNDTDSYELKVRTDFDGVISQAAFGVKDEKKAIKMMETYPASAAYDFRADIDKMLNG